MTNSKISNISLEESNWVHNFVINNKYVFIGIIGLIITTFALFLTNLEMAHFLFFLGQLIIFISTILARDKYFFYQTCITFTGSILGYLAIANGINFLILAIMSIAVFIYFYKIKLFKNDPFLILGCFGIILLGLGYSFSGLLFSSIIFIAGSITIVLYSFISLKNGTKIAFVFLVLNIVFLVSSISRLILYMK